MTKYKYVLLDFDGTIADSKTAFFTVFNQLATKYKYKALLADELESLRNISIIDRCHRIGLPLYRLPFMVKEFYPLYKKTLKDVTIFEGIKEMLEELKNRGYILKIVSSNSPENISALLKFHKINFIPDVFSSTNLFGKDRLIARLLRRQKILKDDVIYIGDELRDILACRKCGIKIIWVGWGFDNLTTIQNDSPDYIVHKPAEILDILQ